MLHSEIPTMTGFSSSGFQMSFVHVYERNSVEIVVWPKAAWAGSTHANKVGFYDASQLWKGAFLGFFPIRVAVDGNS